MLYVVGFPHTGYLSVKEVLFVCYTNSSQCLLCAWPVLRVGVTAVSNRQDLYLHGEIGNKHVDKRMDKEIGVKCCAGGGCGGVVCTLLVWFILITFVSSHLGRVDYICALGSESPGS